MVITITTKAYLKLKYFVKHCDQEISGLGKVKFENDKFVLYDVDILQQKVSAVSTILDAESLALFLQEKLIAKEKIKDYRVWWHSHANMKAYFSVIDANTINEATEFEYLISLVLNKSSEMEARLDIHKPVRLTIPLEIELEISDNKLIEEQCEQKIKEKVKTSIFGGRWISSIQRRLKKKFQ